MIVKPIYEFLLWDNCNNNCKFCFQRENPRLFNHNNREMILNKTIEFIESDKFIKGSHILVCGGEIFDKPNDFGILDKFFCQILKFMMDGTIDLLYINTNLIYKDLYGIDRLLRRIKELKLFDRLRFTTSYDLEGRFKSKEDEELMLSNLKLLGGIYKDLKIVTNTILTKKVCEQILNNKFNVVDFMTKYNCWVNLVPYIVYDENLAANRSDIIKALKYVNDYSDGYISRYILNFDLGQDKLLYMFKDNEFKFCSCENSNCGHSINFKRYSPSGNCFVCDLKEIFNGTI